MAREYTYKCTLCEELRNIEFCKMDCAGVCEECAIEEDDFAQLCKEILELEQSIVEASGTLIAKKAERAVRSHKRERKMLRQRQKALASNNNVKYEALS